MEKSQKTSSGFFPLVSTKEKVWTWELVLLYHNSYFGSSMTAYGCSSIAWISFEKKNVGSPLRFFSCGFSTLKLFTRFLFQLHLCLICWYRLMLNSGSLRLLGRTCFSSSLISFNTLIHVVQKSDQVPLVWKIYEYMIQKRTYPNEVTIQTMVRDALLQWLLIPVWS